ncbi:uncharacterized protein LOC131649217 [Vicia villosa]|uniref:uncharacterized protein LOC131649217 n=1 Tax=Vicia villosa TaxID=3911 RepID=UPI00273CE2F1|nr:uncharacterized protein LOC131649217 [Vicia villosa]
MHARKSTGGSVPETFSVQGREGSAYVHNAIAGIVTRILNEGHKVEGISVPLAQMSASENSKDDQDGQDDVSKDQDNVETSADKNDETPVAKYVETSEFIVNLSQDCADGRTDDFHKVYVRRKCIEFSPTAINHCLGRNAEAQPELEVTDNEVCNTITGGKVKKWPIKSKLSASLLTVKYALLHKIGAANWVPTNHTSTIAVGLGRFIYAIGTKTVFDYGTYIFDQTMRHAGTSATKLPIAFPSLICGIILKQYPGILKAKDSVCKRESALTFHYKLLQRTDASTSAGKSQTSKAVTKASLIAELKETCKELENRKMKLEQLIQSLEQSADSGDDHAAGSDGEKMDADSDDEYKAEDDEDADAQISSSSDVEMSEEDDEVTAGSED